MQTIIETKRKFLLYLHEGKITKQDLKRLQQKQQMFYADVDSGLTQFDNLDDGTPIYASLKYVGEDSSTVSFETFKNRNKKSIFDCWYGISKLKDKLIIESIMQFAVTPELLIMETEMQPKAAQTD